MVSLTLRAECEGGGMWVVDLPEILQETCAPDE